MKIKKLLFTAFVSLVTSGAQANCRIALNSSDIGPGKEYGSPELQALASRGYEVVTINDNDVDLSAVASTHSLLVGTETDTVLWFQLHQYSVQIGTPDGNGESFGFPANGNTPRDAILALPACR